MFVYYSKKDMQTFSNFEALSKRNENQGVVLLLLKLMT